MGLVYHPCQDASINLNIGYQGAKSVGSRPLLYPLHKEVVGGYIGFTSSVRPSIRPAFRVRSVAPKVYCKISKFEFLAIF